MNAFLGLLSASVLSSGLLFELSRPSCIAEASGCSASLPLASAGGPATVSNTATSQEMN